jgi:hypothetical protein
MAVPLRQGVVNWASGPTALACGGPGVASGLGAETASLRAAPWGQISRAAVFSLIGWLIPQRIERWRTQAEGMAP